MLFVSLTSLVNATIVEFQTSQGNIQVNLFDQTTPKTVENFLKYVDEQHYTNSLVHRTSPGFVVQGGGFSFNGEWPLVSIGANDPVINEPVYSNVKGTIAMAKVGGNPNSATDQWFFNLKDNNTGNANQGNLDIQNSGFTAFGQVIGDGMSIVNKIAGLDLCQSIPMVDYSGQNCSDQTTPGIENFVVINQIIIIDSSDVTDADLTPAKNTQILKPDEKEQNSSGGGTMTWLALFFFGLLTLRKALCR